MPVMLKKVSAVQTNGETIDQHIPFHWFTVDDVCSKSVILIVPKMKDDREWNVHWHHVVTVENVASRGLPSSCCHGKPAVKMNSPSSNGLGCKCHVSRQDLH